MAADYSKILLDESEMPTQWYNVIPDLPTPPPPPLHPGTHEPIGPDDLAPLFPMGLIMQEVATDSYIDIQAARLMTIACAERMDTGADARTDISAIKIFVPQAYERVVDRAIQVWGAAGVSGDLPLAGMYQGARTLRLADGPDEVHKILIAKNVLKQYAAGEGWDFGN